MMSGNIVPFPTKEIRDWNLVSEAMIDRAIANGLTASEASEFVQWFKPIFEMFHFEFSLSLSVDPKTAETINCEMAKFIKTLQDHTSKLIAERFDREIRIYLDNNR